MRNYLLPRQLSGPTRSISRSLVEKAQREADNLSRRGEAEAEATKMKALLLAWYGPHQKWASAGSVVA